jgi:hypothetical protein
MYGYCMFLDLENYIVVFEKYISTQKLENINLNVNINTYI